MRIAAALILTLMAAGALAQEPRANSYMGQAYTSKGQLLGQTEGSDWRNSSAPGVYGFDPDSFPLMGQEDARPPTGVYGYELSGSPDDVPAEVFSLK